LGLWTDNSDDHEFAADDEEKDSDRQSSRSSVGSKLDVGKDKKLRTLSGSGQERRGSILSLWSPGKDKEGQDVMHHGDQDDREHTIEEEK